MLKVLSDSSKRKQYDHFGTATDFSGAGGQAPGGNWNTSWNFKSNIDPEEFFRQIFNQDLNDKEFTDFDPLGGFQRGFTRTREVSSEGNSW